MRQGSQCYERSDMVEQVVPRCRNPGPHHHIIEWTYHEESDVVNQR